METTCDGLLNRRVTIEQPAEGFRVAVDTVLLAAAVPARAGECALDFGCGVGGAMLCLAARVPGLNIAGIEIQGELVELCRRNIARNNFAGGIEVVRDDVARTLDHFSAASADHILMNPPYHDEARHDVSAHAGKRMANTEKEGELARWIAIAAQALKPTGILTLIHRADRLEEILAVAAPHFGKIEVLSVLPKAEMPAKRVILRLRKGMPEPPTYCPALVLHRAEGGYTDAAESILRHAKSLDSALV